MCIRDSTYEAAMQCDVPVIFEIVNHPEGLTGDNLLEQSWICLLYTSDAADERSSVDLGGRRIIKKKKKMDMMSST